MLKELVKQFRPDKAAEEIGNKLPRALGPVASIAEGAGVTVGLAAPVLSDAMDIQGCLRNLDDMNRGNDGMTNDIERTSRWGRKQ